MSAVGITIGDLRDRVCHFLGYGAAYSAASAGKQADAAGIVRDALRNFYNTRRWLFLRPLRTVTTDDANTVLGSDIAAIQGDGHLVGADGRNDIPVIQTSVNNILAWREQNQSSGYRPRYFAVTPGVVETTAGNIIDMVLMLYPEPTEEVTLAFRAMLRLSDLDNAVVIGGDVHGDVMIEACLAIAEQRRDDAAGLHTELYEQKLQAAVLRDADQYGGSYVGYMGNNSDAPARLGPIRDPRGPIELNL
jgi:hypothetical protein